jgi:D-alanyl-D-alanine carboxypeptidase
VTAKPPRAIGALAAIGLATSLLVSAAAPAAGAAGPERADARLDRAIDRLVGHPQGPPGAIALVRRPGGVEVHRAGVASLRSGEPPHRRMHVRQASTAKAFSGAVALALVDRGRLALDDTVGERLAGLGLPPAWAQVTLAQLLHHTSGVPSYSDDEGFRAILGENPRHRFDSRRLWEFVADQPLRFPPGTDYRYSNTDNILVALFAEAATGATYGELLDELVFGPAGLRRTSLPRGWRMPSPYVHGYGALEGGEREDFSGLFGMSGVWASGAIVSTPLDMTRFARAYVGARLFDSGLRRRQMSWVRGRSDPPGPGINSAGLAIFRYRTRCGTVFGHTGNIAGYTQLFAATRNARRSLTFTINAQVVPERYPGAFKLLRGAQVRAVCAALARRG